MKYPRFYGIMITIKNPPRAGACGSVEAGSMICDLRSDHSFDHLQHRTTWKLWALQHIKARFSDEKARKSTQNEAKNRCFCVWEQNAAGSSPVTPTSRQCRQPMSLFVLPNFFVQHAIVKSVINAHTKKQPMNHRLLFCFLCTQSQPTLPRPIIRLLTSKSCFKNQLGKASLIAICYAPVYI